MARYSDTVRDQNQLPVIGALVAVVNQDGTTPVLTDDDDNVLINPLTTDGYGTFYFNSAAGFYDLTFYYGGRKVTEEFGVQVPAGDAPAGLVPLVYDLGELTASKPLTDLSEEWNNAAVDFVGERRRITGTAYDTGSVAYSYEFNGQRVYALNPKGAPNITAPIAVEAEDAFFASQTWNDGQLPGDFPRETAFHMATIGVTYNPVNQVFDDGLHSQLRLTVSCDPLTDFSWIEFNPPTLGAFSGGIMPGSVKLSDPFVPGGTSYAGINYSLGILNLSQGIDSGTGRPNPLVSFYYDDFNPATGTGAYTTAVMRAYGTNRLQIQNNGGAIVHRNDNGRYEWESSAVSTRLSFVGYYLSDGKVIDYNNSGQVGGEARVPFSVSTITTTVDTQLWSSLAGGTTWTNRAKMDGLGNLYTQSVWIGATIGAHVNSGPQGPTPVTNDDVNIARASAGVAQLTGALIPEATGTRDLGSTSKNWRRAYANAFVSSGNTQAAPATSHTGDTTETTLATFVLPAGAMGPNGQIEVEAFVSMSGAASTKTLRVSFGGTLAATFAVAAATVGQQSHARIANKTAATQICFGTGTVSGYGASTSAAASLAIDTTAAVTVLITGQLANAADTITLESYLIKTTYGA